MGESTKENGLITTWRGWECTPGKTAEGTKVSTRMIRSTDTESTHGLIKESTKVCGLRGSSTVLVSTQCQAVTQSVDYGKMVKELSGLITKLHKP